MNNIFLILFFFYSNLFSQLKTIQVEYQVIDIIKQYKKTIKNSKRGDFMVDKAMKQKFNLYFNDNLSGFLFAKNSYKDDSEKRIDLLIRYSFTYGNNYFLNKIKNKSYTQNHEGILIEDEIKTLNWKITKDSKKIDIYTCYRAILEIKYTARDNNVKTKIITAWFAPQLPYSYGPLEYYGLPGLIIELQDRNTTYQMNKIKFDTKELIKIPKGKTISKEAYDAKLKAQMGI